MQVSQDPQPAQLPQPAQPAAPGTPAPYVFAPGSRPSDPVAVLRAARAHRQELRDQLSDLEERRQELARELHQRTGADRTGVEQRIAAIDQRILELDKQLSAADLSVAKAAAIPGAVVPNPPPPPRTGPPEGAFVVGTVFTIFVLFPLALAHARRVWRRSAASVAELPKVIADRLTHLDQAIDAIAIELERVGEGQRFLTKVMTDGAGRALGAGPAQPVEVNAGEGAVVPRSTSR